jgi:hypothetical protein
MTTKLRHEWAYVAGSFDGSDVLYEFECSGSKGDRCLSKKEIQYYRGCEDKLLKSLNSDPQRNMTEKELKIHHMKLDRDRLDREIREAES